MKKIFEIEYEKHYNNGEQFYEDGRCEDSLKEYEECIKLRPLESLSYYKIGMIHYNNHNMILAEQFFKKCVELTHHIVLCFINLMVHYY